MLKKFLHIGDLHWKKFSNHEQLIETTKVLIDYIKNNNIELLYIGGDVVDDKNKLSPELNEVLTWFFNILVETVDVVVVLGNHDLNLQNKQTSDSLAFFINQANKLNTGYKIYLLPEGEKSDIVTIDKFPDIQWAVWSVKDDNKSPFNYPENIKKIDKNKILIGCFHGAVDGSKSDMGFEMSTSFDVSMFKDCDCVLLNDIHKRQSFGDNIAYSGSWTQINFGETEKKGALLWELSSLNDKYLPKFIPLNTSYGFNTIVVKDCTEDIKKLTEKIKSNERIRIVYKGKTINYSKKYLNDLKKYIIDKKLTNFTDISITTDYTLDGKSVVVSDQLNGEENSFIDFTSDIQNQLEKNQAKLSELQKDALINYLKKLPKIDSNLIDRVLELDKKITTSLNLSVNSLRNKITLIDIELCNFMSYGNSVLNKIDFTALQHNIVGILGNNQLGKSTLLDACLFALYGEINKPNKSLIDLVNDYICDNGYVKLKIKNEADGKTYRITRSLTLAPTSKKVGIINGDKESFKVSTQLVLEELNGDQWLLLQGTERQSTEVILRNIVGTFEIFKLINLYTSKNPVEFSNLKNSQRLAMIFEYLGLDIYEKKEEESKRLAKDIDKLITFTEGELKGLGSINLLIEELNKSELNLENKSEEIKLATEELNKFINIVDKFNKDILDIENIFKGDDFSLRLLTAKNDLPDNSTFFDKIKILNSEIEATLNLNVHLKEKFNTENEKLKELNFDLIEYKELLNKKDSEVNNIKADNISLNKEIYAAENLIKSGVCGHCNQLIKKHSDNLEEYENWKNNQLQSIEDKKNNIKINDEKLSIINSEILELKAKNESYKKINDEILAINKKINDNLQSIDNNVNSIDRIKIEIQKIDKLKQYRESYISLKENLEINKKEKENIENKISILKVESNYIKKEIDTNKKKIDKIKELEVVLKSKEQEYNLYTIYNNCMGKKGVPLYLLQNYIPLLNSTINFYLIGFNFNITLSLGDGKLEIFYNTKDNSSLRNISMTSGMEEAITNMAFRATLYQLSNTPIIDALIIDEAFATLDSTNIDKLTTMLKNMCGTVFKNMFLITHRNDFKELPTYFVCLKRDKLNCTFIEEVKDKYE